MGTWQSRTPEILSITQRADQDEGGTAAVHWSEAKGGELTSSLSDGDLYFLPPLSSLSADGEDLPDFLEPMMFLSHFPEAPMLLASSSRAARLQSWS